MIAVTECGFEILPHPPYSPKLLSVPKTEIHSMEAMKAPYRQ